MANYLSDASLFQPLPQAPSDTVLSRLKRRLAAGRARRAAERDIKYLRGLDRRALDDMGIDIAGLQQVFPALGANSAMHGVASQSPVRRLPGAAVR